MNLILWKPDLIPFRSNDGMPLFRGEPILGGSKLVQVFPSLARGTEQTRLYAASS